MVFSRCEGNLGYILALQRSYSFKARVGSATSGHLYSYLGNLRNLLEPWQDNADASGGEEVDPASLSSSHSDIGIPINFQQQSGLSTF